MREEKYNSTEVMRENINVDLKNESVDSVNAQSVLMRQSGASAVKGQSINAVDSFLGESNSQSLEITRGIAGFVRGDHVNVENGFTGVITGDEIINNSVVGVTVGQSIRMNGSSSGIVIAREVHGAKIKTVFLIASRLDAPVETVVEPRSIVLFGAAAGLVFGLIYGMFRWLRFRR
jgi:hypothetical protein